MRRILLLLLAACWFGAAVAIELEYTPVAATDQVVDIRNAGDGSGRLFLVQRHGRVRIIKNGSVLPTPFIDIDNRVRSAGGEQGLLSIAFAPDFAQSRHFYAWYTNPAGDTVLSRFIVGANPDRAIAESEEVLLTVAQPYSNHNGGRLEFGPDGMLYLGIGDGGSANDPHGNGQAMDTLLGKVIRIDVNPAFEPYGIPADNPFLANAQVRDEIWASGLRNPWRISFDRATGDLYIADVGQNAIEEINFQVAGSAGGDNYGWSVMEGDQCFEAENCDSSGLVLPVAQYPHNLGCSIIGGEVYRGADHPDLQGMYLYGDYCSGRIWGLLRSGNSFDSILLDDTPFNIRTFGQDESGELYLSDGADVYRVSDGPLVVEPEFTINAGLNDAWVNAGAPFQGLFVTVLPQLQLLFLAWFTFDSVPPASNDAEFGAPDQRWVTALGAFEGDTATLTAELTTGGRFNTSTPLAEQSADYGTIEVVFYDCLSGTVSFDFPGAGLAGSFPIERALDGNVPLCEALGDQ